MQALSAMATTIWKGFLTFGLISIPIKLHRAARADKVSFRQLHRADASRVRQQYVREAPANSEEPPPEDEPAPLPRTAASRRQEPLPFVQPSPSSGPTKTPVRSSPAPSTFSPEPSTPEAVERGDLVKGYEYAKDRFVVISKEDLEKITPQTAREMQINEFVHIEEVDPLYFEASYFVLPDKAGERPYALLYQALRNSGYAAVAQVAMHNREHVVIVRPGSAGLILHMMYYTAETHREDEYRTDISGVPEKELQLATMLIENLAAPFEPEKYRDTYREKLDQLIAAKVAGEQTVEPPAQQRSAPVVNILEALQRSLAETARKPAASAEGETKPAPKKRRAGGK